MLDCILKVENKKRAFIKIDNGEIVVTLDYKSATVFHSPGEAMRKALELEDMFGEPFARIVKL